MAVIDAGGVQKRVIAPKELQALLKKGEQRKWGWRSKKEEAAK